MPLLEIAESKKITAVISLEEATAKQVDLYAAFTKGSPDDVVQAALSYIFTKDKDFQRFCEENVAAKPKTALRLKRPPSAVTKPEPQQTGAKAGIAGAR